MRNGRDPAGATNQFALSAARYGAIVAQQVQNAFQRLIFKERLDRGFQLNLPPLHRAIRKCGGMEMAGHRQPRARSVRKWPDYGLESAGPAANRDTSCQHHALRVRTFGCKTEP